MKKNNTKTQTPTQEQEKKEQFNSGRIKWNPLEKVLQGAWISEKGNVVKYPLQQGVTLTICSTDKSTDFGSLEMFGVSITVNIMWSEKKATYFLSYPSYKKSDGNYKNLVNSYDKDLNELITSVLNSHYEG